MDDSCVINGKRVLGENDQVPYCGTGLLVFVLVCFFIVVGAVTVFLVTR